MASKENRNQNTVVKNSFTGRSFTGYAFNTEILVKKKNKGTIKDTKKYSKFKLKTNLKINLQGKIEEK